jgi:hypothetical protein
MPKFASVMMLSFNTIGIPCNGPLLFPLALSSSNLLAILINSCLGATEISALNCLPRLLCCSICCKYASTISTLVMAPALIISESSYAEMVRGSNSGSEASLDEETKDVFLAWSFSRYAGGSSGSNAEGWSAFLRYLNMVGIWGGTATNEGVCGCHFTWRRVASRAAGHGRPREYGEAQGKSKMNYTADMCDFTSQSRRQGSSKTRSYPKAPTRALGRM